MTNGTSGVAFCRAVTTKPEQLVYSRRRMSIFLPYLKHVLHISLLLPCSIDRGPVAQLIKTPFAQLIRPTEAHPSYVVLVQCILLGLFRPQVHIKIDSLSDEEIVFSTA